MKKAPWLQKQFVFDTDPKMLPLVIERLRGTHMRLLERTDKLTKQQIIKKLNGKWSINEHIGHLIDLENLWEKRIRDYLNPATFLSPADMQNRQTEIANYNTQPTQKIITEFALKRQSLIDSLENLTDEQIGLKLYHQRLNVHMNAADTAYFVAEHDDHHIATITEIRSQLL